ncbi:ATPase, partial [bacterium]|nr:ATPase [bacterium]
MNPISNNSQSASEKLRQGLSQADAEIKLKIEGPNELSPSNEGRWWHPAIEIVKEPMLLLLIGAGVTYWLLGDPKEAALLMILVVMMVGITWYQEQRTARALLALRALSSPRALVIRDGQRLRIPGREVVRNDIVILSEGDRIPA